MKNQLNEFKSSSPPSSTEHDRKTFLVTSASRRRAIDEKYAATHDDCMLRSVGPLNSMSNRKTEYAQGNITDISGEYGQKMKRNVRLRRILHQGNRIRLAKLMAKS